MALNPFYTKAQADAAFQPLDSDLSAIAALSTTAFGRALLALADPADATKVLLGNGTFGAVPASTPSWARQFALGM